MWYSLYMASRFFSQRVFPFATLLLSVLLLCVTVFNFSLPSTPVASTINQPETVATSTIPDISKTQSRQKKIRDHLVSILVPNDSSSIYAVVDAISADPVLSLDCHDVAHDVGHRAYELYGFAGAMTYNDPAHVDHVSVMGICAGGYVHGILEEASLHYRAFGSHPGVLCVQVPSTNTASCYHGVGHALMFYTARDIPESLDDCRTLGSASAKSRCFEGVWMETFWGDIQHAGSDSLGWDINRPLAPCEEASKDAKPACFLYAPFGYLRSHAKDYAGAVQLCVHDVEKNEVSMCLKGVGIVMVPHFKAAHLEQSEPFVVGLTDEQKLGFYKGVIGYGRLSGLSEGALTQTCAAMQTDALVCERARVESR